MLSHEVKHVGGGIGIVGVLCRALPNGTKNIPG
jgi:hypothetical protein